LSVAGYFVATRIFNLNLFGGGNDTSKPEEITLNYWGLWEPSNILEEVFAEFQSQHPGVTVQYTQHSSADYRERLQNELDAGNGPDLFRYHNTWVPMLFKYTASMPTDVMSEAEYSSTFYPVATKWLKTRNGIIGIPLMYEGLGLYYNKKIMDAAGITPPKTWDELRRVAKQLTVTTNEQIQRGGVALGTTANVEHWPDIVGLMMLQNSADPAKPNNKNGQDAIQFYTIFGSVDKVWDETLPSSTYAFATEKVVMMIAPSWRAHDVKSINPNLEFAIAPAPQLPETDISWASFWAEGVNTKAEKKKQELAWELLKFLSSKESLRKFYADASEVRLFGEPFSRVDMADQLQGDSYVGALIGQAPKSQSWYLSSFTHDNGINDNIIKYYQDAVNQVAAGTPPDKALAPAEEGIAQVLSRYGLK